MFWTIVGALAFFFIVLPLIFQVLMQKWFWYLTGWLVLALFAFVIIPECSRDSQRRSYQRKQVEAQAQAEALAQQQKAEQIKAIDDRRRNMQIEQAREARHQADLRAEAARRQRDTERLRQQAERIHSETIRSNWSVSIKEAVEKYLVSKEALKRHLASFTTANLQDFQEAIFAEEVHHLRYKTDYDTLHEIQMVRLQIDIEMSKRSLTEEPVEQDTAPVPHSVAPVPSTAQTTSMEDFERFHRKPKQVPDHYKSQNHTTATKADMIRATNPDWRSNVSDEALVRVYLQWYPEEKGTIIEP